MNKPTRKTKLPGLTRDVDRHGNVRLYYRVKGQPKIRLTAPEGSDEFLAQYRAARAGELAPAPRRAKARAKDPGSVAALIENYRKSSAYRDLHESTRRVRNRLLIRLEEKIGAFKAADLTAKHVRMWRDAPEGPEAGNAIVKTLRQVLQIAVEDEELEKNVAKLVKYRAPASPDGFTAWTIDDIKAFVKRHPRGTKAYLALCLYLFTAQRRSDVHQLGRQHEVDGGTALRLTQQKNRSRKPVIVELPILTPLRDAIDACPNTGQLAYIVSEHGRPFKSAPSFGNWFGKRCREAGLEKGKNGHGIRKHQGDLLASLGLSAHEIMAILGHSTIKQAEVYTRRADRKRLAHQGMKRLEDALNHEQIVPLAAPVEKVGQKRRPNA